MTGHRATVRVDGVEWELHADGSRTATVGGREYRAARIEGDVWALTRADAQLGPLSAQLTCEFAALSEGARTWSEVQP